MIKNNIIVFIEKKLNFIINSKLFTRINRHIYRLDIYV